MKHALLLASFLFAAVFSFAQGLKNSSKIYQVITSHPEEVRLLQPHVKTVLSAGRLWIVEPKAGAPASIFKFLRATSSGQFKHYTPVPDELPQSLVEIESGYLEQVSTKNLQAIVAKLASYKNRSAGTAENLDAQKWIASQLQAMGYEVKLDCYKTNHCSVIADKKGTTLPNEVILVEGHFDSVGRDFAGADDNATGSAATLEIARVLKDYANKRTLRFFLTNGEESGLLGSEHYAASLTQQEIKNIKLVINMDMVGYNSNGIVELETDKQYEELAKWFAALAAKYTTLKSKITLSAWGSDHVPFLQLGIPTLLTIEDWSTKTPCYHQTCDRPETVNFAYQTEITKLNLAAVMLRDQE